MEKIEDESLDEQFSWDSEEMAPCQFQKYFEGWKTVYLPLTIRDNISYDSYKSWKQQLLHKPTQENLEEVIVEQLLGFFEESDCIHYSRGLVMNNELSRAKESKLFEQYETGKKENELYGKLALFDKFYEEEYRFRTINKTSVGQFLIVNKRRLTPQDIHDLFFVFGYIELAQKDMEKLKVTKLCELPECFNAKVRNNAERTNALYKSLLKLFSKMGSNYPIKCSHIKKTLEDHEILTVKLKAAQFEILMKSLFPDMKLGSMARNIRNDIKTWESNENAHNYQDLPLTNKVRKQCEQCYKEYFSAVL